jgi:hypothetical protein
VPLIRNFHRIRNKKVSWIYINWEQNKPGNKLIERLWGAVNITVEPETFPAVDEYLAELRRINTNGGAFIARFHVNGNEDFNWFATRNRWDEIEFFSRFLSHPAFASALPEVATNVNTAELAEFEWSSSLTLDGELARTLVVGGAYEKFEGTPREAKALGERVAESLFGDRFDDVLVFRCWKPWSSWFCDVAWDGTTVLIDKRLQIVTVLVSTDTD